MSDRGLLAVIEWVDALAPEDVDAALRSLSLCATGHISEKRYRLIRYQLRQQAQANVVWNDREDYASVEAENLGPQPSVPISEGYREEAANFDRPISTTRPIASTYEWPAFTTAPAPNTQRTTSSQIFAQVPSTVTSTGIWPAASLSGPRAFLSTTTELIYSGNHSIPTVGTFPFERSTLRDGGTASTPHVTTIANGMPPLTGNFSFIGHQSLLNNTRELPTITTVTGAPAYSAPSTGVNPQQANGALPRTANTAFFPSVPSQEPQSANGFAPPPVYSQPPASFASSTLAPPSQPPAFLPRSTAHPLVHAGEIVRKWNVKFDGKRDHSAEEFLLRVSECRTGTRLTENDLLDAMPTLLSGVALQWFRLERPRWTSWQHFVAAFRRRFGGANFQLRVREEVRRRTQGQSEPIADFLVCLRHIMSYVTPPYSEEEQLDFAFANLHPKYQEKIERDQIRSLEELEAKGEQIEATRLLIRGYQAPPTAKDSMFPEHAYVDTGTSMIAAADEPKNVSPSHVALPKGTINGQLPAYTPALSDEIIGVQVASKPTPNIRVATAGESLAQIPSSKQASALPAASTPTPTGSPGDAPSKPLECNWCHASGKTTRTCVNEACIERREILKNQRRRRSGSNSPPANKVPTQTE